MKKIIVVGLGPGGEEYLTIGALKALERVEKRILRTERHGVVPFLKEQKLLFQSLDFLYQEAENFNELNERLTAYIISEVLENEEVIYAVPGHGIIGDATVEALLKRCRDENIEVQVIPGLSQGDYGISLLPDCVSGDFRTIPALEWESFTPDPRIPTVITEIDNAVKAGEVKIKLLDHYPPEHQGTVTWLEEGRRPRFEQISLCMLDQMDYYDHTVSYFLPPVPFEKLETYDFAHLVEIMKLLRSPNGCPWDREQTHKSLKQYLIEEAYEVLEAIDAEDTDQLMEELGDVLLQVVFHAQIASEKGEFGIHDVTSGVCGKMIYRHTHIFGEAEVNSAEDVVNNWEAIKKKEKGLDNQTQVLEAIPSNLPALMRSYKVQQKAALVGFDWDNTADAIQKVDEELAEFKEEYIKGKNEGMADELGDLLFAVVNVARFLKIQPELALTGTVEKFINRFRYMEEQARQKGNHLENMTLEEMDELWNKAKNLEKVKTNV